MGGGTWPGLGGGVPWLGGRGVPGRGGGGAGTWWGRGVPGQGGGGYLAGGRGYLAREGGGRGERGYLARRSVCCAAGGMPLAFTQEDFLVFNEFNRKLNFELGNCSVTPQAQYSPLLLAAGRKDAPDPQMIQILLTAGADINFKCMYHTTALHEAVERGHTRVIQRAFLLRSFQCIFIYLK